MITRIASCLLLAAGSGCVSPISTLRAENHRLSAEVVELRADHRAQDRKLRDLEHQLAMSQENAVVPDQPQLPVVVMDPPPGRPALEADQRVVGLTDDGTEIIYEGDAAAGKVATMGPVASHATVDAAPVPTSADRLEVTHARIPPVAARATHVHVRDTSPQNEAAASDYRAAVELVKAGQHEAAQTALRAFLKAYPRHDYADNAQYWLGEDYYAQKDFTHALAEFRATIETYPRGNKVPDALLKVGYCYQALGQADKAHAVLEQVVNLYPKSEPAVLASKRLETP